MDKQPTKAEIASRLIKLKEEIVRVEQHSESERRKMKKDLDRKMDEIKVVMFGNKKDIRQLWKRSTDNTEDIERLQDALNTVFKIFVTTVIGIMITGIFGYFFELF